MVADKKKCIRCGKSFSVAAKSRHQKLCAPCRPLRKKEMQTKVDAEVKAGIRTRGSKTGYEKSEWPDAITWQRKPRKILMTDAEQKAIDRAIDERYREELGFKIYSTEEIKKIAHEITPIERVKKGSWIPRITAPTVGFLRQRHPERQGV